MNALAGSHTQEEGHAGFLHLAFAVLAKKNVGRRIRPFPSSTVKSNFVYYTHEIVVLHLTCWA